MKWAWGLSDQEKTKHNPQEGRDTEGGWGERGGDRELGGTERRNSEVCPFKCGCKMPHCSTLERIPLGRRSHAAPGWGPLETAPRTQAPPRRKGNAQELTGSPLPRADPTHTRTGYMQPPFLELSSSKARNVSSIRWACRRSLMNVCRVSQ